MLLTKYMQASSNVVALNRVLLVVVALLSILSVFNYQLAMSLKNEQKTVLLSPNMAADDAYVITGNTANKRYLIKMARYALGLFLNYSPTNVSEQFEELVLLYSPTSYEVERQALMDLKERVQRSLRITSTFVIEDVIKDMEGQLTVKGQRTRFNKDKVTQTLEQSFRIEYEIKNGRFYILRIREAKK